MVTEVVIDAEKLDALFAPYDRTDRPGIAVGIAHRGVPVYRRGFGLANMELSQAFTPSVRSRIGSTTKHFTALCLMLLAEEGKLKPTDSVRKYLPELNDWADGVTLAGLMSHTSGTRCSIDLLSHLTTLMGRGSNFPADGELKMMFRVDSVNFAPGTYYSYSNGGYALLTEVVQRVSGRPYGEFLKERILTPVGMNDTQARPLDTDILPNSAAMHIRLPSGWMKGVFGPPVGGTGNIVSTIDDMLRWLKHMSAPIVGTEATWAEMRTPIKLANGTSTNYGYGLFRETFRGLQTLHHGGTVIGGSSQMLKVLGHELDIVIFSNGGGSPPKLTEAVIDACITDLEPAEATMEVKEPVTGDFYSAKSARFVRLAAEGGKQVIVGEGGNTPLKQRADGSIVLPATLYPEGRVRFSHDELTWDEYGVVDRYARLGERDPSGTPAIIGHYDGSEFGVSATVEARAGGEKDGDALFTINGPYGQVQYKLTGWTDTMWVCSSIGTLVPMGGFCLVREGDDLFLTTGRNNRIRFRRIAA